MAKYTMFVITYVKSSQSPFELVRFQMVRITKGLLYYVNINVYPGRQGPHNLQTYVSIVLL